MSFEAAALIATWIFLVLFGLALAGIVRQIHIMQGGSISGIRPEVQVGERVVSTAELGLESREAVLLFADEECSRCRLILEKAERWTQDDSHISTVVVSRHQIHKRDTLLNGLHVLDDAGHLFDLFRVPAVPFAVAVNHEGVVRMAAPVGSIEGLEAFLNQARQEEVRDT